MMQTGREIPLDAALAVERESQQLFFRAKMRGKAWLRILKSARRHSRENNERELEGRTSHTPCSKASARAGTSTSRLLLRKRAR